MKVNGNTIKPGNVIEHKGSLWVATKTSHVKPGKGGAFAQIELRNLKDGTKLNERFRSSENIEKVILEETPHVFLYKEGDNLIFMNNENFEFVDNGFFGASLLAFHDMLKLKNFDLIAVESSGTNAFFINKRFSHLFEILDPIKSFKSNPYLYSEDKKLEIFSKVKNHNFVDV